MSWVSITTIFLFIKIISDTVAARCYIVYMIKVTIDGERQNELYWDIHCVAAMLLIICNIGLLGIKLAFKIIDILLCKHYN